MLRSPISIRSIPSDGSFSVAISLQLTPSLFHYQREKGRSSHRVRRADADRKSGELRQVDQNSETARVVGAQVMAMTSFTSNRGPEIIMAWAQVGDESPPRNPTCRKELQRTTAKLRADLSIERHGCK